MSNALKVKDVARILNCSESLVRTPAMLAALGAFRIGKRGIRFHHDLLEAYIARGQIGHAEKTPVTDEGGSRSNLTDRHGIW
ncbi:helix-turn-helix domain-containing protein [Pseudodesulfovibrio portus]|uniref:helix-turn-helix domain-containing protein n=1 Tax=Pseudodesulfovibrio portus TaxID=231439 RepID=UPI002232211F|nr:helix-turn-helix domain-containing protein [Pseudodesulfovibrio portus]